MIEGHYQRGFVPPNAERTRHRSPEYRVDASSQRQPNQLSLARGRTTRLEAGSRRSRDDNEYDSSTSKDQVSYPLKTEARLQGPSVVETRNDQSSLRDLEKPEYGIFQFAIVLYDSSNDAFGVHRSVTMLSDIMHPGVTWRPQLASDYLEEGKTRPNALERRTPPISEDHRERKQRAKPRFPRTPLATIYEGVPVTKFPRPVMTPDHRIYRTQQLRGFSQKLNGLRENRRNAQKGQRDQRTLAIQETGQRTMDPRRACGRTGIARDLGNLRG